MAVHVGDMTSEVDVVTGDLPLSAKQVEKLVELVARRVEQMRQDGERDREGRSLRQGAAPPLRIGV
jgi:hypothetical protein